MANFVGNDHKKRHLGALNRNSNNWIINETDEPLLKIVSGQTSKLSHLNKTKYEMRSPQLYMEIKDVSHKVNAKTIINVFKNVEHHAYYEALFARQYNKTFKKVFQTW